MKGYVVVFEGDGELGYSAYSPDLPGSSPPGPPARRLSS
jgi:predicted RNase H-like HicB family nuclease